MTHHLHCLLIRIINEGAAAAAAAAAAVVLVLVSAYIFTLLFSAVKLKAYNMVRSNLKALSCKYTCKSTCA
jgi:hypothetical protein